MLKCFTSKLTITGTASHAHTSGSHEGTIVGTRSITHQSKRLNEVGRSVIHGPVGDTVFLASSLQKGFKKC
jgi:hypothetical protein